MSNHQKDSIVLIGCGAMALEAALYLRDMNLNADNEEKVSTVSGIFASDFPRKQDIEDILEYKVEKYDDFSSIELPKEKKYVICIGSNVAVHMYLNNTIRQMALELFSVIHPTSYVAKTAKISDGVILAPNTFVGPCAKIGAGAIVNVGSSVGHDCVIGEACVISPHVNISGSVEVGDGAFFGSKTSVDPGVKIGRFSKMISGSSVRKDLKDGHLFLSDQKKTIKMFNTENGSSLFSRK